MKRLAFILLILTMFIAPSKADGAADLSRLNRLDGVSVYSDKEESRIVIRFAKEGTPAPKPVFFEKSIQLDIEGSYVNPAQRTFKLNDEFIPSAAAYQMTPTKVRLRLFIEDDGREYAGLSESAVNGNLMILAIKKETPPAAANGAVAQVEESSGQTAAVSSISNILTEAGVIKEEEPEVSSAPPAEERQAAPEQKKNFFSEPLLASTSVSKSSQRKGSGFLKYEEPTAPEAPSLRKVAIKMLTALSFVLAMVFALAWGAKKYMGKFGGGFGAGGPVRVLASSQIDIKKSVMIVDVAGEALVLGISGDNITMLTKLEDEERVDLLRRKSGIGGATTGKAGATSPTGASPALFKKAVDSLRIGKVRTKGEASPALFDEEAEDTFSGALARAGSRGRSASREDLLRHVTGAIRSRNEKLNLA